MSDTVPLTTLASAATTTADMAPDDEPRAHHRPLAADHLDAILPTATPEAPESEGWTTEQAAEHFEQLLATEARDTPDADAPALEEPTAAEVDAIVQEQHAPPPVHHAPWSEPSDGTLDLVVNGAPTPVRMDALAAAMLAAPDPHAAYAEIERAAHLAKAHRQIAETIPEWKDTAKRAALQEQILHYAQSQGATREELAALGDPRVVVMLYKNMRAEAGQEAATRKRLTTETPGSVRRAAPRPAPQAAPTPAQIAVERFRKTGRVIHAAEVFQHLFGV